jgi:hypothetical protein
MDNTSSSESLSLDDLCSVHCLWGLVMVAKLGNGSSALCSSAAAAAASGHRLRACVSEGDDATEVPLTSHTCPRHLLRERQAVQLMRSFEESSATAKGG